MYHAHSTTACNNDHAIDRKHSTVLDDGRDNGRQIMRSASLRVVLSIFLALLLRGRRASALSMNECALMSQFRGRAAGVIEPAKGLAGFTPMPHAAMSDTGARCALNKTEGPLSWSQGPHYGTLVGTVTAGNGRRKTQIRRWFERGHSVSRKDSRSRRRAGLDRAEPN